MSDQMQERMPQTGLTFEDVWAAMMETDKKFKETDKKFQESAQQMLESRKDFDQQMLESRKDFDRRIKKTDAQLKQTDKAIGKLGHRLGDLIEHIAASNIVGKFRKLGYEFTRISREHKIKDGRGQLLAEIDILLENGEFAMAVEVKSLLTRADVQKHLKRMGIIRAYADERQDTRKYVSAVTGALIEEDVRSFALKNGLYVIEQSGDRIQIKSPDHLKVW
jgi:hypothetical protein